MGGGASTANTTSIITRSAVEAVARNIMNCKSNAMISQTFTVSGNYNVVRNTKQVQNIKLSSSCAQDAQNIADLQQSVANAVKQSASSQGVSVLGALGSVTSENNLNLENDIKQTITQENIQNIINSSNAKQEIIISGDNNVIDNFTQEQTYDIVYDNAQKVVNTMKSLQVLENNAQQESKSVQTNFISDIVDSVFSGLQGMGWLVVVVVVAAIIFLGPVILKGGPLATLMGSDSKPVEPEPPALQQQQQQQQQQEQQQVTGRGFNSEFASTY